MAGPMREQTYLILVALAGEPRHGYGIIQSVAALTDGHTKLGPGTLYGALDRLVSEGSIEPSHGEIVDGRLRRYYRITERGQKVVAGEAERLAGVAAKVAWQLGRRPGGLGAGAAAT